MFDPTPHFIREHFEELVKQYPSLILDSGVERNVVTGDLKFSAEYGDTTLVDCFAIQISIPSDYPESPPSVKETGGRIPADFHKLDDDSLCLAAPFEILRKFSCNRSLLGFVKDLLIPYLFSFSYWEQNGVMPYGELAHGAKGILEYYVDLFNVSSSTTALKLLKILAEGSYKGHHDCPCGSGRKLRDCHGSLLRNISSCRGQEDFFFDFCTCATLVFVKMGRVPDYLRSKELDRLYARYIAPLVLSMASESKMEENRE
ncbi:MAG: YecA family protein [Armatimonadota bacterium]